jgi:hypothetical protein
MVKGDGEGYKQIMFLISSGHIETRIKLSSRCKNTVIRKCYGADAPLLAELGGRSIFPICKLIGTVNF